MKIFDSEDVKTMEEFNKAKTCGYYISSKKCVDLFNKIFEKRQAYTNCGSCINRYYSQLLREFNIFKDALKEEENKKVEEEPKKKKPGRPKKGEK